MKVFTGKKIGRVFFIRIDLGDDVADCIEQFIAEHNVVNGIVTSAIGTLSSGVIHHINSTTSTVYPASRDYTRLENKPLEVCSIDGLIVDGKSHLHTVIADGDHTYAGHLHQGCKSLYVFEMAVLEVEDMDVTRKLNKDGRPHLENR